MYPSSLYIHRIKGIQAGAPIAAGGQDKRLMIFEAYIQFEAYFLSRNQNTN